MIGHDRARPVFTTKGVGSRFATRVRVASPVGSVFDGWRGPVVNVVGGTYLVRLDTTSHGLKIERPTVLPFSAEELLDAE